MNIFHFFLKIIGVKEITTTEAESQRIQFLQHQKNTAYSLASDLTVKQAKLISRISELQAAVNNVMCIDDNADKPEFIALDNKVAEIARIISRGK